MDGSMIMNPNPDELPVLRVEKLRKTFGSTVAVNGVSFEVKPGEILAILGPSGCGKTTTLRMIAGLEEPNSGEILVNGKSVLSLSPHRRNIGLVFQDLAIFPHKSVFENVAFGLRMKRVKGEELRRRVHEILVLVELLPEEFAGRSPATLSGGQLQRVALARTLVMQPSLVLFDEPMVSLDRRLRDRMVVEVRQIQKRLGLPAIYVTHDQESASFFSDRVAVMEAGQIVQTGTPLEIYRYPRSQFVANFIGDTNFFPGTVVVSDKTATKVELFGEGVTLGPEEVKPGEKVTLAIRPEDTRLSHQRNELSIVKGKLRVWNFNAGMFHYRVALEDGREVVVRSPSKEYTEFLERQVWLEASRELIRIFRD
jgi:ABC-type Fe3+/spermidine/putrescine transport system ATPase subunit